MKLLNVNIDVFVFLFLEVGEDECPHVLYKKVQKNFTVERFDNGR